MGAFTMPSLGADMDEGLFVEWLVKPGDEVKRGQVVCVVETQKGAVDVEIWESGVVERLFAEPGQTIPVGAELARIATEAETPIGESAATAALPAEKYAPAKGDTRPSGRPSPSRVAPRGERVKASPAARRRAAELGVDLERLKSGAADGAISLEDVERAVVSTDTAPQAARPVARSPAEAMRDAIAAAMSRSNRDIPHYHLGTEISAEAALAWLEAHNEGRPVAERALFAVLQLRAVARALHDVPQFNGWCVDGRLRPAEAIHIGVATALRGGGLVTPALRDADGMTLEAMSAALRDLLQRARGGKLHSSELSETSITVTNLGDLGVDTVHGVIYPPQVALVGFGRIRPRPWVDNGRLVVARTVHVTLAADHRVSDGAAGARFLGRIADYLQEPENLWASD